MRELWELISVFLKISIFSFGGGYVMIGYLQHEFVSRGWISANDFANIVSISQMTPGPIAVNAATYVGYLTAGLPGALTATFSVALPSFVLISLVSYFMEKFRESAVINGALAGVRPMTAGLVLSAVMFMGQQAIGTGSQTIGIMSLAICVISFVLTGVKKISPIMVMLGAGIFGALFMS